MFIGSTTQHHNSFIVESDELGLSMRIHQAIRLTFKGFILGARPKWVFNPLFAFKGFNEAIQTVLYLDDLVWHSCTARCIDSGKAFGWQIDRIVMLVLRQHFLRFKLDDRFSKLPRHNVFSFLKGRHTLSLAWWIMLIKVIGRSMGGPKVKLAKKSKKYHDSPNERQTRKSQFDWREKRLTYLSSINRHLAIHTLLFMPSLCWIQVKRCPIHGMKGL